MRSMRPGFQTSLVLFVYRRIGSDPRLKAWPRGLRPLRCSFSRDCGIGMTANGSHFDPFRLAQPR
jgi:hypothetical protein